jgi:hypothetical protein
LETGIFSLLCKQKTVDWLVGYALCTEPFILKQMTLLDFQQLEQRKQLERIKLDGCFLFHRQEPGLDIVLYQVRSFYAEIYYRADKSGSVNCLKAFGEEMLPERYTNDIDISEILRHLEQ